MKSILILGIGSAQVDALRWCRTAGLEVHACGVSEQGTGRRLADRFALMDIRDAAAVERYVLANGISVVYSVGSDAAMPTAARVSEKLGLPSFFPAESAVICNNKHLMREALGPDFAGNLRHLVVRTAEEAAAWKSYPCIMKPADNQGQRGVFILNNPADLQAQFLRSLEFSPSGRVVLEEYADGPEVSANVYMQDGEVRFLQVTDRIVFAEYPGIVSEHRIPSAHAGAESAVRDLVVRVLGRIRIPDGPVYFQLKLTRTGPVVLEATPRLDGCHLWRLIREYCGVDLLECTFRHLLGEPLPSLEKKPATRQLTLVFPSGRPGDKVDRQSYDIGRPLHLEWYYESGETIRPINGLMEKVGYFIRELPANTDSPGRKP